MAAVAGAEAPRDQMAQLNEGVASLRTGDRSDESKLDVAVDPTFSRRLGPTEENWCNAVNGGTGNTVLAVLMKVNMSEEVLQKAVDYVQIRNPRVRSRLVPAKALGEAHENEHGQAFQVPAEAVVKVEVIEGWQPRDSYDHSLNLLGGTSQISRESSPPSRSEDGDEEEAVQEENGNAASATGGGSSQGAPEGSKRTARVDTCFEIGRRSKPGQMADSSGGSVDSLAGPGQRGACRSSSGRYKLSMCRAKWLQIVEASMNEPWESEEHEQFESGVQLLAVCLYRLPGERSLIVIRAHTMACDRVSAAAVIGDLLNALDRQINKTSDHGLASGKELEGGPKEPVSVEDEEERKRLNPKHVEACIPKHLSSKPFWAHGIDVLGYGLGSRRHACLPFNDASAERKSELIRSGLTKEDTDLLLEACTRERTSLHGIVSAAFLLAAARSKKLGDKGEHYAITSLLDLRPHLPEELQPATVGFFHSALLNTHHVSESTDLWDLARRCHESVTRAVQNRKHFTDMGDLNLLMAQAMQHPQLTPSSSLRTSMLCSFCDPLHEHMEKYAERLNVEDYIGCSSVHGVGPCLAIFDSIREDGLHLANVYPSPLFSRSQMRGVVTTMMELLHEAIQKSR